MSKNSPDELDNERTDKLPVLLEAAALEDVERSPAPTDPEDTSEHTARLSVAADAASSTELIDELRQRAEQIPSLEAQIHTLQNDARELAQRLAERERRLDELNATVARLGGAAAPAESEPAPTELASPATKPLLPDPGSPDVHEPRDDDALRATSSAAQESPPILTDAVDSVTLSETGAPAGDAIAQLEAEVGYKRQQVTAQLVELRDREQRLRALASELEQARREIGALRTALDEGHSKLSRLERAIVDKDRAIEARDSRIATLQEELRHRQSTAEQRSAGEQSVDAPGPREAREGIGDHKSAPILLCLTGDAPKRFALTKTSVMIGRAPQCDLQIVTHFVSREHARLTLNASGALIEDLGSRNGVFVNSVRVDRHHLQQGDLLTIGQTQFRFVESMAH